MEYILSVALMRSASGESMLRRSWKYVGRFDARPHDAAAYAMRWCPKPIRIVPTTSGVDPLRLTTGRSAAPALPERTVTWRERERESGEAVRGEEGGRGKERPHRP